MTRVLIAAGYPLIAGCLRRVVETSSDFEVVGEVISAKEILDAVRGGRLDVLLLCMSQPEANPLDLIRRLHIEAPSLQICAVSFGDNARFLAMPSLRAGAAGFVTKFSSPETLHEAIRKLASGERYVDMIAVNDIMQDLESGAGTRGRALSQREIQVLQMLTDGRQTSEIADMLNLSVKTVSTHKTRLYQKLHVNSVAELVRYAVEHKLISA
ncbi:MAG: LuxR C-terminal-related transcriptional regulator [Ignavibacteria bacterium]